ncbi:hypothetical protein ACWNT8_01215 [Pigmentibacter ruber]
MKLIKYVVISVFLLNFIAYSQEKNNSTNAPSKEENSNNTEPKKSILDKVKLVNAEIKVSINSAGDGEQDQEKHGNDKANSSSENSGEEKSTPR